MLNSFRRIVVDHYVHALRLFREIDAGVIRLHASVQTGDFKNIPIWTAFITHQVRAQGWASFSQKTVLIFDIQQFVFTTEYNPQKTSSGALELAFTESSGTMPTLVHLVSLLTSSDARDFIRCLERISGMPRFHTPYYFPDAVRRWDHEMRG